MSYSSTFYSKIRPFFTFQLMMGRLKQKLPLIIIHQDFNYRYARTETVLNNKHTLLKGAYWISSNCDFFNIPNCSPFGYRSSNFAIAKLSLLLALKSDSEE